VSASNKSDWLDSSCTIFAAYYVNLVVPSRASKYYKTGSVFEVKEELGDSDPYAKEYKKYLDSMPKEETEEVEFDEDVEFCDEAGPTATAEPETETKVEEPEKPETLLDKISSDASLKAPSSKKDGFFVSDDDWALLVRNIQRHVNTMIIGPTGCGKTSVVREICSRMGKKLYTFDMGTMMDPVSSLLGVHRLDKGESIFDYAKFTQVIKEPCVILLDELSRAPLSAMNVLFSCLDDRRNLNIEIALGSGEREIDVNPEVTFVATANVGTEYSGTNSMDRALVNRFFPLELGCIPKSEEVAVLVKRTGVEKKTADIIVKIADNIRSLCNKQEVSVSLSIRETLMVASLVADGWSIGKAMEMIYLPLYEGTKSEGERGIIYKTISSY
jgi:MoxR-like ATPase